MAWQRAACHRDAANRGLVAKVAQADRAVLLQLVQTEEHAVFLPGVLGAQRLVARAPVVAGVVGGGGRVLQRRVLCRVRAAG